MLAKKSLGQYFLRDEKILKSIVRALGDISAETVVEIGGGCGGLTKHLIDARTLIVYELDDQLAPKLENQFPQAQIRHQDFLDATLEKFNHDYLLIGNIPYFITGLILRKILNINNYPKQAVLTVQKEYGERLLGVGGNSFLSNWLQVWGRTEKICTISRSSFSPPPKIDSMAVKINFYSQPLLTDPECFARFLKTLFRQPRQMIGNNLKGSHYLPILQNNELFLDLKTKRPHELSFDEIMFLFKNEQGASLA